MKVLLLVGLLILTACQSDSGDDMVQDQQDQVASKPQWIVNTTSVNFPKKFSVYINGSSVLSTCQSMDQINVSQSNDRTLVSFKFNFVPNTQEAVNVDLVDHSIYCNRADIVYSEKYVQYHVANTGNGGKVITAILKN